MKNTKFQPKSKPVPSDDSFLEAFRDLGSDFVSTAKDRLVKDGAEDFKDALFPFSHNSETTVNPGQNEVELKKNQSLRLKRLETFHREEKILFTREQRETQQMVNSLQKEIRQLAKVTSDLANEAKQAEITAMQNTVEAGTYHINFFSRLRTIIANLRSQLQESSLWLAAWNKKAQRRNFYWNQFKKSGSKFLLSSDRYVATQAG